MVNQTEVSGSVKRFDIHDLTTPNTDLKDCLRILESRQHLFLMDKSQVIGINTRADRQKPAVRMMFFGMVTIFESQIASLINLKYPNNSWKRFISQSRLDSTKEQHGKLLEKNLDINLINCTQICDKTGILLKDKELLSSLTGLSKTKAKDFFKRAQDLRNDLERMHSLCRIGLKMKMC